MSLSDLQKFYQIVSSSEELQQQLDAAKSAEAFTEKAILLGQDNGYSFTSEELESFINQKRSETNAELSDAELEAVAGGKGKRTCPLDTRVTFCILISSCWGSSC